MYEEFKIKVKISFLKSPDIIELSIDVYPYTFTVHDKTLYRNTYPLLGEKNKIKYSSCWSYTRYYIKNTLKSNSRKFEYDPDKLNFDIIFKENDNHDIYLRTSDEYTKNYFDDLALHRKIEYNGNCNV